LVASLETDLDAVLAAEAVADLVASLETVLDAVLAVEQVVDLVASVETNLVAVLAHCVVDVPTDDDGFPILVDLVGVDGE
jgi:Ni2+-binding GTPase involved in maturation of urease and hydrogenase